MTQNKASLDSASEAEPLGDLNRRKPFGETRELAGQGGHLIRPQRQGRGTRPGYTQRAIHGIVGL